MTEPRGDGPMGPEDDDLAAGGLGDLDLALDELAAGRDVPTERVGGETAALAALATELRAAVPPPPAGAAERGRAAFLAAAASGRAALVATAAGRRARGPAWRRSLPLRMAAVAAALVVLVALPATARQARPGTTLWPVRQVGQQVRDRLADDPVGRAHLRLNTAESYLAAGAGAGEDRREDMADRAEEKIEDALDVLDGVAGPEAAAERARAQQLLLQVDALEHQEEPDRHGTGSGDDRSGRGGGGDDPSGDDRSGRGGSGSGGGSSSGPGPGSSSRSGSGSRSGKSGSGSSSLSGKSSSGSGDD
jgi:uncharacterized membrane protein YgcG